MAGLSLYQNSTNADRYMTSGGTYFAWAVFVTLFLSTLVMVVLTFIRPRGPRFFHHIAIIILATSTIAYFAMASNTGAIFVVAEPPRENTYARQVVVRLLVTIYTRDFFIMGLLAFFSIWFFLLFRTTAVDGQGMRDGFVRGAAFVAFITILYPIATASDSGATRVVAKSYARQVFFIRYIQWSINFPLLLIIILLKTGIALTDILTAAFFSWIVVVTGLIGALTPTSYKWGFFVLGLLALFFIWYFLLYPSYPPVPGRPPLNQWFIHGARFFAFITILYVIAWGFCEGGDVVSRTGEMIWYGILDLIVVLFLFLWLNIRDNNRVSG
ncbi:hypothetical protein BC835DRAFT_923056 [Cytidiella melzeri]|nr:hypothetical protein BC835DRAFT_923056 [Cytidiella melzeri]